MSFLFRNNAVTSSGKSSMTGANLQAASRMQNDPDIAAEQLDALQLPAGHPTVSAKAMKSGAQCPMARLNVVRTSHTPSAETAAIVKDVGGLDALRRFTSLFYEKAFQDPHIDQFILSHHDAHGERFATWIAEKMGEEGMPWSSERRTRKTRTFEAHGYQFQTAHDRSSAHFAAWHSPKRDPSVWGEHFKLDTCRVWMRLHFWAAREEGVLDHPAFADYYSRFIGHFVSVYEGSAPPFCRESMRWSADPANIQRYLDNGRRMPEIMGLSQREALATLPPDERPYTGSKDGRHWPYDAPTPKEELAQRLAI